MSNDYEQKVVIEFENNFELVKKSLEIKRQGIKGNLKLH